MRNEFEALSASHLLPIERSLTGEYIDPMTAIAWTFWLAGRAKRISPNKHTPGTLAKHVNAYKVSGGIHNVKVRNMDTVDKYRFPDNIPMQVIKTALKWHYGCKSIRGKAGPYEANYL